MSGWLVGWLVGWLGGWFGGWLVCVFSASIDRSRRRLDAPVGLEAAPVADLRAVAGEGKKQRVARAEAGGEPRDARGDVAARRAARGVGVVVGHQEAGVVGEGEAALEEEVEALWECAAGGRAAGGEW